MSVAYQMLYRYLRVEEVDAGSYIPNLQIGLPYCQ